jgi:hypothetical protein
MLILLYPQEELIADISSAVSQALQQSPLLTASRAQLPPYIQAPGNDILIHFDIHTFFIFGSCCPLGLYFHNIVGSKKKKKIKKIK